MRKTTIALTAAVLTVVCGCSKQNGSVANEPDGKPHTEATLVRPAPTAKQSGAEDRYTPPNAEELAPMRAEYTAELAKIDEPPEMAEKPMRERKPASSVALNAMNVLSALGSPEKATHSQRAAAIDSMLGLTKNKEIDDSLRSTLYGAIAMLACVDGADPQTVIGYASNAIAVDGDGSLALRARMYLKAGKPQNALDDLEQIMVTQDGHALTGGNVAPSKESEPCGWSIVDFDKFGIDPRGLAAKGFYLSSFFAFGAQDEGAVSEAEIHDLYMRASKEWHSPIPHYLAISTYGIGSGHSMNRVRCVRASFGGTDSQAKRACATFDEDTRQQIRALTMALVIDPTFAPALAERAGKYLTLAQGAFADDKPSRELFELAIKDYTAAIGAGGKDKHMLYCDRALAQASIGKYQDAALGYEQGMKFAKDGIENSPFVYQQLAGIYVKLGRFIDAENLMTKAIINSSGGGMDVVILQSGIKGFRMLYPEYDLLPDEILAEAVRRRYYPDFPKKWNEKFISGPSMNGGHVLSSILPELYIARGDAYMKAGLQEKALADYSRVKSDAWGEGLTPRQIYFDENGRRNFNAPEPFPPPPARF